MSDPRDFLGRWSRRKLQPDAPDAAPGDKAPPRPVETLGDRAAPVKSPPPEEFDLTKLPPLKSIAAGTDVRVFLQRGVPVALTHAALRRAWVADPAIRDFIGLAENSWDFNAPNSLPGFGPLNLDEIRRAATQLFGDPGDAKVSGGSLDNEVSLAQPSSTPPDTGAVPPREMRTSALEERRGARSGNVEDKKNSDENADLTNVAQQAPTDGATQHQAKGNEIDPPSLRRLHGGALPE
jgi:hypothetical protein